MQISIHTVNLTFAEAWDTPHTFSVGKPRIFTSSVVAATVACGVTGTSITVWRFAKKMLASHEKTNFNANCTKTFQLLHTLLHTLLHQLRRQLIHIQASCMRFVYCSSEDGPLCSTTKARNARQGKGALQQTAVIKEAHLSYTWHVLKHLFSGCYLDIIWLNCRYKYTQHCHFGDTQLNPVKLQVTNNIKPLGRINTTSAPARVSLYLYFSVRRL